MNIEDKEWRKWHPVLTFVLYLLICIRFINSCRTDVKTLYAFKEDVRPYVGNLIYSLTLQMDDERENWFKSRKIWILLFVRRVNFSKVIALNAGMQGHAVPLTVGNHQFSFVIGYYSVAKIWYVLKKKEKKKEMKMIKTQILSWKTKNSLSNIFMTVM